MADNLTLNAGSGGATLATDDVTGVQYQVVKIDVGGDGVSLPLSTSNRLPVSLPSGFATETTLAACSTSLQDIDGVTRTEDAAHVSGDPGYMALAVRKAAPANLSGTDGDYEPLQVSAGRVWASATIDAALPAGTNNIGDVDVLTMPADPFGANADAASSTGSISAKLRFIAATGIPITGNPAANIAQVAGTATDTNSGLKSAGTIRVVLATDQPALTNKLLVTPDSVALPANQSVNVSQVAGTTTDTNSGNKSAGTIRVVLATDQPALTNKLLVTPDANSAVNVAQMNGVTVTMGNGVAGTGVQRVAIASDNTAFQVTPTPGTAGGWSKWSTPNDNSNAALSTTVATVKASAGTLGGYIIYNPNASVAYVQIFDVSGTVTLGTTRPNIVIGIPASSGANIEFTNGVNFANAIKVAATTTASGSSALGSGLDCSFVFK